MAVPFLACMALAASLYNPSPRALPSIQGVEGGGPTVAHANADGSEDLGAMQVNTRWIPALVRCTGKPAAYVRARLLGPGCYNVAAAGWICGATSTRRAAT